MRQAQLGGEFALRYINRVKRRRKQTREDTAKVFWSGGSQAIRLPRKYRVSCREMTIRRLGSSLVLEPATEASGANGWPPSFWKLLRALDADFDVGDRERKSPLK